MLLLDYLQVRFTNGIGIFFDFGTGFFER